MFLRSQVLIKVSTAGLPWDGLNAGDKLCEKSNEAGFFFATTRWLKGTIKMLSLKTVCV